MIDYAEKSLADLMTEFVDSCLSQDDTFITGDAKKYNKLYSVIEGVSKELARRSGDARRSLLTLFRHKNPHVRLQAALFAYSVAPADARTCLEAIASARLPDQSLAARMALSRLKEDPHCLD